MTVYEERAARALHQRQLYYGREVQRQLKRSLDEMRGRMTAIYARHARDGVLSRADMTRYNRYVTMEKEMLGLVNEATRRNMRTIERLRPEQYGEAFFRHAWAIDQATGVRVAWGTLNRNAIVENLANEFYHISRQRYGMEARLRIRTTLAQGIAQGYSYPEMSNELRRAMNVTNYQAMRILRTEGQTAMNAGQEDVYTDAAEHGIEGNVVWDSTLDAATRPQHQDMDGHVRGDDGLFVFPNGDTAPYPAHSDLSAENRINCRCSIHYDIEGFSPGIRRTRDAGVVPYQTYSEWKTSHPTWRD